VGNVDADGRRLIQTAFECLALAMDLVRPGTLYRDLGTVIERKAKENKCSVVRTYCGHGIGKELFHTIPNIAHVSLSIVFFVVVLGWQGRSLNGIAFSLLYSASLCLLYKVR
jgi:methionine aminopeptidase